MLIRNNETHKYNTRNRTSLHVPIGATEVTYTTFRRHVLLNIIQRDTFKHLNSVILTNIAILNTIYAIIVDMYRTFFHATYII